MRTKYRVPSAECRVLSSTLSPSLARWQKSSRKAEKAAKEKAAADKAAADKRAAEDQVRPASNYCIAIAPSPGTPLAHLPLSAAGGCGEGAGRG